ncbi:hypothetical protein N566_05350 [Streptomycetaceae bacterium MP113-05]|nr:hypothetical protein N566_05350 [Streptomycetaceae bacterium MP113-05]
MTSERHWFKSSYSDTEGSNCVEVAMDWRKSSHSGDFQDACVEVAACPRSVHVRDSKLGARSPELAVSTGAWSAFVRRAAAR